MEWTQSLTSEFEISIRDPHVWAGIGVAAILAGAIWVIGSCIARLVRLTRTRVQVAEAIGVGLAVGTIVSTSWWATAWSGGRSSFTPVGVAFAVAIALGAWERTGSRGGGWRLRRIEKLSTRRTAALAIGATCSVLALCTIGLLYASTLTLSPRDGAQPLEFMDQAFYSILAVDLSNTGIEDAFSPAGFGRIEGMPEQTWYHWGEIWLAAATITIFDVEPLAARHLVALPILVVTCGLLGGTLVRRLTGTSSKPALLFGGAVCLFLAPIPLVDGPFFSSWAVGLVFGITQYGMAAVAVLLAAYCFALLLREPGGWARSGFAGTVFAFLLPAHIVIFVLVVVGLVTVLALHGASARLHGRVSRAPLPVKRAGIWAIVTLALTSAWALFTGHGFGGSGVSPTVEPFNATWFGSLLIVLLGAGAFLAIPIAWGVARRQDPLRSAGYALVGVVLPFGAAVWGARLGDFNMFHVFFGGIALIATPLTGVAVWSLAQRLRDRGRRFAGVLVIVFCVIQIELATVHTILRLQRFGPGNYEPIPVALLSAIQALPDDAKLAYACQPLEEIAAWDARLLAIGVHTGRRIVPMCFQADAFASLNGGLSSTEVMSPYFVLAPQRELYTDADAKPGVDAVIQFLKGHDIHYIISDRVHLNTLAPDGTVVFSSGTYELLRLP